MVLGISRLVFGLSALICYSKAATSPSVGDRVSAGIWVQERQPLNVSDAEALGWEALDSFCDPYQGIRYRYPGRMTPTIMFDNVGHIAGLQIVVNTDIFPLYPHSNLREPPVFSDAVVKNEASMTFFFMEPAKVCSATEDDHVHGSVGDRFWLRRGQMSQSEIDFEVIPLTLDGIEGGAPANGWYKGGCAPTGFAFPGSPGMGTHYWQYLGEETSRVCVDSGPVFLLYDRGALRAFGLTFVGTENIVPSDGGVRPIESGGHLVMPPPSLWEFARQPLYPFFFDEAQNPICLQNLNTFNETLPYGDITTGTMHIFLSDPFEMTCEP